MCVIVYRWWCWVVSLCKRDYCLFGLFYIILINSSPFNFSIMRQCLSAYNFEYLIKFLSITVFEYSI